MGYVILILIIIAIVYYYYTTQTMMSLRTPLSAVGGPEEFKNDISAAVSYKPDPFGATVH